MSRGGRMFLALFLKADSQGKSFRGCVHFGIGIRGSIPPSPHKMSVRHRIRQVVQMVPGKKRFGLYRFLPVFFILGGAMEWFMINVRLGKETFYDVYRRKRSERQYQQKMEGR
uniref:Ubiquinol-cytochrome c reductase complex assembly factor 5 n=1 Tax=Salvator merianae TaxID=96440 RepID=A0A8D0BUW2_SALMN